MSQNAQILDYLKKNKRGMTQIDAIRGFNCFRLAARIHDLKAAGHNIESITETKEITTGLYTVEVKRWSRYFYLGSKTKRAKE